MCFFGSACLSNGFDADFLLLLLLLVILSRCPHVRLVGVTFSSGPLMRLDAALITCK